jgi:hypothetical protein
MDKEAKLKTVHAIWLHLHETQEAVKTNGDENFSFRTVVAFWKYWLRTGIKKITHDSGNVLCLDQVIYNQVNISKESLRGWWSGSRGSAPA